MAALRGNILKDGVVSLDDGEPGGRPVLGLFCVTVVCAQTARAWRVHEVFKSGRFHLKCKSSTVARERLLADTSSD